MNDQPQSPPSYRATAFADSKPDLAAPGGTPERLAHLQEHGFVIIDDFVGNPWIPILREAGRRVTEACAPENGYSRIDSSEGYVHRAREEEPWAIRGLTHPAFGEPGFAEFHGSPDFLGFVESWCNGLGPEEMVMTSMLLWCNPRRHENGPSWHRDVTWWGTGKAYVAQRNEQEGSEAYSEEVERIRWEEIRANNARLLEERDGVSMFLALVDDECHELIPGSHHRWRTPLEHDVLLPQGMKDKGVPYTPSWNGTDPLPGQEAIRLKAGEALIRNGATIHTGHTVPRPRAQHPVGRLVEVEGPVHRGAVGGGRAPGLAARPRGARGPAPRVDEDGLGPLGGNAEAGGHARGPLRRLRHQSHQVRGGGGLAQRAGAPGRGRGRSLEAFSDRGLRG